MSEVEIEVSRDGYFPWYWTARGRGITRVGTFRWGAIYRWRKAYRKEQRVRERAVVRREKVKVKT